MKKIIFKLLAYIGDMLVVGVITGCLSYITLINPSRETIEDIYSQETVHQKEVIALLKDMKEAVKDDELTESEYKAIVDSTKNYKDVFREIKEDEKASDWSSIMTTELSNKFQDNISRLSYEANRKMTVVNIITVIVYILYFGVFEFITGGQTLFKKIFKLRTLNTDGTKVSLVKEIIRSVLICELVFIVFDIFAVRAPYQKYIKIDHIVDYVKYFYELAFIVVMMMRDDTRSIHDLILGTKVIRYDVNGVEIEDRIFNNEIITESKPVVKEVKKVKTKTTKPNKTTKAKKTTKEVVKAEKVK